MIDREEMTAYGTVAGIIGAAIIAGWRSRGWLKRRASADAREIANDGAEVDMLGRAIAEAERHKAEAQRQRDIADRAWTERNEAVGELRMLRSEVATLTKHRVDCEQRLERAERRIEDLHKLVDGFLRGGEPNSA